MRRRGVVPLRGLLLWPALAFAAAAWLLVALPAAASAPQIVAPGGQVTAQVGGFAPGATVTQRITGGTPDQAQGPGPDLVADASGGVTVTVVAPDAVGEYQLVLVGAPASDPSLPSPGSASGNPAAVRVIVPRLVSLGFVVRVGGSPSPSPSTSAAGSAGSASGGSPSTALTGIDVAALVVVGLLALAAGVLTNRGGRPRRP